MGIALIEGRLIKHTLLLEEGEKISTVGEIDIIKYLGCSFSGELVKNDKAIKNLNENLIKLTSSNLLKPDQKLNVLNQYLFPTLTYPLQTAPLTKLSPPFLERIDIITRRIVKAILALPANTSISMMYAPRRFRGLGLLRCDWEAPLQHLSLEEKLINVPDSLFQNKT